MKAYFADGCFKEAAPVAKHSSPYRACKAPDAGGSDQILCIRKIPTFDIVKDFQHGIV